MSDNVLTGSDAARAVPQQDRSRQMVSRIIDATVRLIGQHGATGLSTNAVAFAANISVGSLYRYFPNKDALIVAAVEREGWQFHDRIRARANSGAYGSAAQAISSLIEATFDAYRAVSADNVPATIELGRKDVFDRRSGARIAIAAELMANLTDTTGYSGKRIADGAPVIAEIIVALIEAAITRPTEILHGCNVVSVTSDIAANYIETFCKNSII